MTKKIYALFCAVCLACNSYAQPGKPKRLYIGIALAPVKEIQGTVLNPADFVYKTGLDLKYCITDRIGLTSGILVKNSYYKSRVSTSYVLETAKSNSSVLQIPLRIDIRLKRSKISPLITAGGSYSLYRFSKSSYHQLTYTTANVVDYTTKTRGTLSQPSAQLGFGLDVTKNSFKLQAFPFYEATFYNSGGIILHSVGLAASLSVGF